MIVVRLIDIIIIYMSANINSNPSFIQALAVLCTVITEEE